VGLADLTLMFDRGNWGYLVAKILEYPQLYPLIGLDLYGLFRTIMVAKVGVSLVFLGLCGLPWTRLDGKVVAMGGLEPPTPAL
jgi:hypothetical protein